MNDDVKLHSIWAFVIVLGICGVVFGGITCERNEKAAVVECVKSGRTPLECRVAVRGSL